MGGNKSNICNIIIFFCFLKEGNSEHAMAHLYLLVLFHSFFVVTSNCYVFFYRKFAKTQIFHDSKTQRGKVLSCPRGSSRLKVTAWQQNGSFQYSMTTCIRWTLFMWWRQCFENQFQLSNKCFFSSVACLHHIHCVMIPLFFKSFSPSLMLKQLSILELHSNILSVQ